VAGHRHRGWIVAVVAALLAVVGVWAPPPALAAGDGLSGTVTSGAAALDGVSVTVYSSMNTPVASTTTGALGQYAFTGLAPGNYKVGFTKTGYVPVFGGGGASLFAAQTISYSVGGAVDPVVDVSMVLGATISGTILSGGLPVLGANASVSGPNATFISAVADSVTGVYTLVGVPAGQYQVRFSAVGYLDAFQSITVVAGQTLNGIDGTLVRQPTISGIVTDAGGARVANATVRARSGSGAFTSVNATTTTNTNGEYTLALFAAGSYSVSAGTPTLAETFTDGTFTATASNAVAVAAGQQLANVNIQLLAAAATITGTVRNTSGVPVSAFVGLGRPGSPASVANTGTSGGVYTFTGLAPGTYTVNAFAPGLQSEYYDNADAGNATPIVVTAGQTAVIDVTLGVGGTVTGSVLDASGVPVPPFGSSISLLSWPNNTSTLGTGPGPNGTFTFGNVRAGQYVLYATGPGGNPVYSGGSATYAGATPFTVTDGQTSGPFTLTLRTPGRITGRVLDALAQPVVGATVSAILPSGLGGGQSAVTGSDGRYEIVGATGSVRVQVNPPQNSPWLYEYWTATGGTRDVASAGLVTVPDGGLVPDIDFVLDRGATVSGRVTNEFGQPMSFLFVSVIGRNGEYGGFATTDATGAFTAQGVNPGTDYLVWVSGVTGYLNAYHGSSTSSPPATGFSAALGQVITGKDVQLTRAGVARFTASPAGSAGFILMCPGDTTVTLAFPTVQCGNGQAALGVEAAPGVPGTWVGSGLVPGTYSALLATFAAVGPRTVFTIGAITDSVDCTMGAPGQAASNCTVAPGGTVTGRVTGPNNTRADAPVEVTAYGTNGAPLSRTLADANGYFRLIGLPTAAVRVGARPLGQSALGGVFTGNVSTLAAASTVAVTAGASTTGVNLQLVRAVSGTLQFVDAGGNPVDPGQWSGPVVCGSFASSFTCANGQIPPFAAVAGQVGKFTAGPFDPGNYLVRAIRNLNPIGADAPITVASGDTFACTTQLPAGPTSCTVTPDPNAGTGGPSDADGVGDAVEDANPAGADGNGDGTPDAVQPNVTSLPAETAGSYVTVAAPSGALSNVTVDPVPAGAPAGAIAAVGTIGFDLTGITPGSTQVVDIVLPPGVTATGYAKFLNGLWSVLPPELVDLSTPGRVRLTLRDGDARVDEDGVANGVIVDPGVPVVAPPAPPVTFGGFYAPVDMGGVVNVVKAGSTVPLKFEMFQGGVELTSLADVASFRVLTSSACTATAPTDEVEFTTLDPSGLKYTGGVYQQNWKTPKMTGCFRAVVTAKDGRTLSALFRLR
jgi:hypothetical protein